MMCEEMVFVVAETEVEETDAEGKLDGERVMLAFGETGDVVAGAGVGHAVVGACDGEGGEWGGVGKVGHPVGYREGGCGGGRANVKGLECYIVGWCGGFAVKAGGEGCWGCEAEGVEDAKGEEECSESHVCLEDVGSCAVLD